MPFYASKPCSDTHYLGLGHASCLFGVDTPERTPGMHALYQLALPLDDGEGRAHVRAVKSIKTYPELMSILLHPYFGTLRPKLPDWCMPPRTSRGQWVSNPIHLTLLTRFTRTSCKGSLAAWFALGLRDVDLQFLTGWDMIRVHDTINTGLNELVCGRCTRGHKQVVQAVIHDDVSHPAFDELPRFYHSPLDKLEALAKHDVVLWAIKWLAQYGLAVRARSLPPDEWQRYRIAYLPPNDRKGPLHGRFALWAGWPHRIIQKQEWDRPEIPVHLEQSVGHWFLGL